ncbi:helix-turn-helix transcriptional regulator [Corynebacterium occultum]|uniref:helix-turn-helix transcriptional regulator n=1 Tax=Corynebacterium occultum TaxID=2675219 RepID=UPI0018CF73AD|nr:LuxR family transcriptional regulator [Corynebacterium occultum]
MYLTPSPRHASSSAFRKVTEMVRDLEPGNGVLCVITGPGGAGKSSFARELVKNLPGWSGVRVTALSWRADNEGSLLQHILDRANHEGDLRSLVDVEGATTAIVVDDVHWADQTSLRALIETAATMKHGRLALLFTASDTEVSAGRPNTDDLREMADVALTIPPMDVEDVRAFALTTVGAHLAPFAAAELRDLTGGRPNRIREVLQAAPADHWRNHDPKIPVPNTWRAALLRRIGAHAEDTALNKVLTSCAILPDGGTSELLQYLADDPTGETIDTAVSLGLLELLPRYGVDHLTFTHPTDLAVVRTGTGPLESSELHLKAARFYLEHHDQDSALKHQALGARGSDDDTAEAIAQRGLELGASGHWRRAARAYELSSQISSRPEDAHDRHLSGIEALIAASDLPQARLYAGSLGHDSRDVKVDSMRGYLALHEGRFSEAKGHINRAWQTLEDADSQDRSMRARVASRKVLLSLNSWEPENLIAWAKITDEWALPGSPTQLEARYISLIGQGAVQGRVPDDVPLPGETPILAQRRNMALGWLSLVHDDPVAARQRLQGYSGAEGSERISLWMDAWLARTYFVLGEWESGVRAVERGLARAERYGIRFLEPLLLWTGASIAAYRGERELARSYVNRLTFSHDAFVLQRVPSAMCRLLLASLDNDMSSAMRAGRALESINAETNISQPGFWPWEDVWAQQLLHAGKIEEADAVTSRAEEIAAGSNIASIKAKLGVPRAGILMQRGDIEGGIKVFDQSLEQIESLAMPSYQSRILYEYGRVLRRLGRRRQADEIFTRAGEVYEAMGATEFVNRCNRERRAGGLGTRTTGAGGLTPQEQEIAKLVAEGATNREVARELFLSAKTVEYHLTRVYRKLGVRTRNELPRVLREL